MVGKIANAWAARDSSAHLSPYSFQLRERGDEDMLLKVLYCGVDHTDVHEAKGELTSSNTNYPFVPGHEIVGEVVEVGSQVHNFKVGDKVGVGGVVGSCLECDLCNSNLEQYCNKRVFTYNHIYLDGTPTHGGFSSAIVIHHRFAVKIPEKLAPEQAAPLLCAGVTAYSPLKQFMGTDKVYRGGILGLGGVGHLGVIIAKAMGHHVTVISSSDNKKGEAMEDLHANAFLVSTNDVELKRAMNSLDYILDTVPASHPLELYLSLLKAEGKLIIVGAPPQPLQFVATNIIQGKKDNYGKFAWKREGYEGIVGFMDRKGIDDYDRGGEDGLC